MFNYIIKIGEIFQFREVILFRNNAAHIIRQEWEQFCFQELRFRYVHSVFTIHELNNRTVAVTNRHIIMNVQTLQMLNETSLQIT